MHYTTRTEKPIHLSLTQENIKTFMKSVESTESIYSKVHYYYLRRIEIWTTVMLL